MIETVHKCPYWMSIALPLNTNIEQWMVELRINNWGHKDQKGTLEAINYLTPLGRIDC